MTKPMVTVGTFVVTILVFVLVVQYLSSPVPEVSTRIERPAEPSIRYATLGDAAVAAVTELTVVTGVHAEQRHTAAEATRVREHMRAKMAADPTWANRPPCKDGRTRYTDRMPNGKWGVWVLEQVGPYMIERTAFETLDHDYILKVNEECGNGDWFGHVYGY